MYQTTPLLAKGLRQRYGVRRLGVIGNSIGGMAAGLCAEHFDALCLTAAPAGLTDYVSERLLSAIERIPDPLIRLGSVAFDLVESARNADYREKTHAQFKQHNGYAPYAQFGAARIPNMRKFIAALRDAPRLDEYAHLIGKPSLLLYGGEDHLLGIKNDVLPQRLQRMCDSIPAKKNLYMITGAGHSLNRKTRMDSSFNHDYEFAYVKEHISYHFADYL